MFRRQASSLCVTKTVNLSPLVILHNGLKTHIISKEYDVEDEYVIVTSMLDELAAIVNTKDKDKDKYNNNDNNISSVD
jgi:hypothetical protein